MRFPNESFAAHRERVAAEIARQRTELAFAFHNLEKPIHYAEYGMRGFGFLRQNPWVLTAVPAVFSIGSSLLGLRKGKTAGRAASQRQSLAKRPKGLIGHAVKWGGHGLRLFRLYRRVRQFLP